MITRRQLLGSAAATMAAAALGQSRRANIVVARDLMEIPL